LTTEKNISLHRKYVFYRSLDPVAREGGTILPHPGYAPRDLDSEEKRSAENNWMDDNVQDNRINGPRKEFESGSLSDSMAFMSPGLFNYA